MQFKSIQFFYEQRGSYWRLIFDYKTLSLTLIANDNVYTLHSILNPSSPKTEP